MDKKGDIYKNIGIYFLDPKNNNMIKNKKNPYYISLLQNKKEILNTLKEKDINDIEVTIPDGEITLYSIEGDTKKVEEIFPYNEEKIPLKEIVLEVLEKEWSIKLEGLILRYIDKKSKKIIMEMKDKIRAQVYENTDEINDGIDIISYQKNYIYGDYENITKSAENLFEYINQKDKVYDILNNRLNEAVNKEYLGEEIKLAIYEDIGIKDDIQEYNRDGTNHDNNKLFSLINNNTSNKDIISKFLGDEGTNQYMKEWAQKTYEYITHNFEKIEKNIKKPSLYFTTNMIKSLGGDIKKAQFLYENQDRIEDIIQKIGVGPIRENINIFATLLSIIIEDEFIFNMNQIGKI